MLIMKYINLQLLLKAFPIPSSLYAQSAFTCHVKNVDVINKTYERKSERKSI